LHLERCGSETSGIEPARHPPGSKMPTPIMRLTRSISGSRLNPAATHPGCDGRGYHGSLRDRRGAGGDGGGHDSGLRDRRADDADPADT
jgi:hypothetical protein